MNKKLVVLLGIVLRVAACAEPTDPVQPFVASVNGQADASWSLTAPMLETRYAAAAASGADGRIYVFSGLQRAVLSTAEVYNPSQNLWTSIAGPGFQAGAVGVRGSDNRIYLVGGADENFAALKKVQAYDPLGNSWSAATDLNVNRFMHAVTIGNDGRIYALGGTSDGFDAVNTGEVSNV